MLDATLILLPGLHGTADLFEPLIAVMSPALPIRTVAYPTDQPLSYDALLRLLEQQLESESKMVLIAESFSGPLAIQFAVAHPTRVIALVFVASFVTSPVPRWLRYLIHPIFFHLPFPTFLLRRRMMGKNVDPALARKVMRVVLGIRPSIVAHRVREVLAVDCIDDLRRLSMPVLYLAAAQDTIVRRSSADAVLAIRLNIQIKTVTGPHLLLQVNPSDAWREIEGFLGAI